jgi:hypothetical protein
MSRTFFLEILGGVRAYDEYFESKLDATGKVGLSSYQKCFSYIRELAYEVPCDLVDEYIRTSESTCLEAMYRFCSAVIAVFGKLYPREPNTEDTTRLLSINEKRGFCGMFVIIHCIHWEWKNCPFGWQDTSHVM